MEKISQRASRRIQARVNQIHAMEENVWNCLDYGYKIKNENENFDITKDNNIKLLRIQNSPSLKKKELVGGISISNISRGISQSCSLGYWIGQKYARRGYMTEAVSIAVDLAFNILKLHRVEAACIPENIASKSVLNKVGFTEEGYARKYLQINGIWKDHILFAMLSSDRYIKFK